MRTAIDYLSRLCHRWGGELLLLPDPAFRAVMVAHGVTSHPSDTHAIHRGRRQIFASDRHVCPGTVIHEMGHVFLKEAVPFKNHEPNWLGWEIALARRARCYRTWSEQNTGYNFSFRGQEWEWGTMTLQEERLFIANRINYAKRLGILDKDGTPLCTRRPDPDRRATRVTTRSPAHLADTQAAPQTRGDRASLGDTAGHRDPRDSTESQTALDIQ